MSLGLKSSVVHLDQQMSEQVPGLLEQEMKIELTLVGPPEELNHLYVNHGGAEFIELLARELGTSSSVPSGIVLSVTPLLPDGSPGPQGRLLVRSGETTVVPMTFLATFHSGFMGSRVDEVRGAVLVGATIQG